MIKKNTNNNALDLFRILATVQVFFGHIISHFKMDNPNFELVYFVRGVPILFVLCGFLAAQSLEKYTTKEYLVRRAIRILPGFWACIIINTIIILLVYDVKPSFFEGVVYFITQFIGMNFYTGGWLRGYGVGTPNGVLWTISVQIQFFILAPFIYKMLKKIGFLKSCVVIGLLTSLSILIEKSSVFIPEGIGKLIGVTVVPYLYFLVFGMAGYCFRNKIIPFFEKVKWFLLVGYFIWKFAENKLYFPHIFDGVLYNTITTLLICMLVFRLHLLLSLEYTVIILLVSIYTIWCLLILQYTLVLIHLNLI